MVRQRRSCPRRVVDSVVRVDLGPSAGGFLRDLSEGGLAIALLGGTVREQVVRVGFDLPGAGYHIEALGQISWTDKLAHRAGVKFVDIPRMSRQRIRDWIFPHDGSVIFPSQELLAELRAACTQANRWLDSELSEPTVGGLGILRGLPLIRSPLGLIAVLATLFILSLLLMYPQPLVHTTPATSKDPARPNKDSAVSAAVGPTTSKNELPTDIPHKNSAVSAAGGPTTSKNELPTDIPLIPRGAVLLQVAALPSEQEALVLAEALQQRQFPAFVLIPRADHYYRVQIGPYANVESARFARRRLEKEGYKALIKR